jgi:hypothetical protein
MKSPIDELYLYIHFSIARKANDRNELSRKEVEKFLSKIHHYTKPMPAIILKKLENFGLIEFVSRDVIRISKKPIDVLECPNKLFETTKCF